MPDPVTHVHNKIKGMKKCHQINEASQNTRSVLDAYFDPSLYTCRHDIFIPGSDEAFGHSSYNQRLCILTTWIATC